MYLCCRKSQFTELTTQQKLNNPPPTQRHTQAGNLLKGILLFSCLESGGKEGAHMPCPHCKITIVKRSENESAVSAAYQSGEKLFSEYDQQ